MLIGTIGLKVTEVEKICYFLLSIAIHILVVQIFSFVTFTYEVFLIFESSCIK